MFLWTKLKQSKVWPYLVAFGVFLLGALALIKKGENINQEKVEKEALLRDQATRKRNDDANEKISSSPTFVTDWLRANNRFRD
jgi:hypothetical protein